MAQLADAAIMQSGRSTLAGFFNGVIAQLGVDSEQASFMADSQGLIVENLKNWDSSISGVSLDEEVTNLMSTSTRMLPQLELSLSSTRCWS